MATGEHIELIVCRILLFLLLFFECIELVLFQHTHTYIYYYYYYFFAAIGRSRRFAPSPTDFRHCRWWYRFFFLVPGPLYLCGFRKVQVSAISWVGDPQ